MKNLFTSLILTTAIFGVFTAKAQTTDTVKTKGWMKHEPAGAMQIQLTYRKGNLTQLDNALVTNGFSVLKEYDLWINASMNHIFGKWITEDGIGFTPVATSEINNIKAKYNQYQAFGRLGYNISQTPGTRFFPFVGVNFSAAVLDIQDNGGIQNTSSFSTELLNSTASKTFYQPNFGIELGAGFDYAIKLKPKTTDCFTIQRSIPVGIRAGYYFNTYASDWRINSYKLQDSPNQKQSAVFISFNIGLGYAIKKN